ncbi:MAG: DUF2161 family putative PD-(D/E)XK-type phosphodiesterase [Planctomycetaceae bacterium]|nr:DUF2161 family putative PD-(D/E)XK-type phosphodiesterase [Planctomycetaceae bacterium]
MAGAKREADLYPPLKKWLERDGYEVRSEVNDCDVVARRGDELVVIELKRAINIDLLLQVVKRQQMRAAVYAAVPSPKTRDKRWRGLERLLKRLEVGLILVYMDAPTPLVEVAFHPMKSARRTQAAPTGRLLREMDGRSLDCNMGGSVGRPLMTAYRESALAVAAGLERLGVAAPRELTALGISKKAGEILRANHYGWFERLGVAKYGLTKDGHKALEQFGELAEMWREKLDKAQQSA